MRQSIFALLLGTCLLGGTGCVHRELVGFDDHESKPLTAMRAGTTKSYLFWATYEHVFYSCSEQGDRLDCKRVCGGSSDLECPSASGNGYGATTNIR